MEGDELSEGRWRTETGKAGGFCHDYPIDDIP